MSGIISQQSLDLLVSLINQANPTLPFPVTKTNMTFGTPTVITPATGTIQNTSVLCTPISTSGYRNKQTLTYRRIDLTAMFFDIPVEIYKYSPASTGASPYTFYNLLSDINTRYGLSLTTDDFPDASFPAASDGFYGGSTRTSKVTVTAKPTSFGYTGSLTVRWVQAPQTLANVITVTAMQGRTYPGGNNFASGHLYVLDMEAYGIDFSSVSGTLGGGSFTNYPLGTPNGIGWQQPAFDLLNQTTGKSYTLGSGNAGQPFGMYNGNAVRYSLPNAACPEADSANFNTVVIVTLPGGNTWGVGKLYFHYNA